MSHNFHRFPSFYRFPLIPFLRGSRARLAVLVHALVVKIATSLCLSIDNFLSSRSTKRNSKSSTSSTSVCQQLEVLKFSRRDKNPKLSA